MLNWINKKFSKGFYYPFLVKLFSCLERFSLNYWIKSSIKKIIYEHLVWKKPPQWVSESYQVCFIILGIIVLFLIPKIEESTLAWMATLPFIYRLFDILIFVLNWIFVHKNKIHDYKRSIMSFFINLFELAMYVAIIEKLWKLNSVPAKTGLNLFYDHSMSIFTLNLPLKNSTCKILSAIELFISTFILLFILAGLVGSILRDDTNIKRTYRKSSKKLVNLGGTEKRLKTIPRRRSLKNK